MHVMARANAASAPRTTAHSTYLGLHGPPGQVDRRSATALGRTSVPGVTTCDKDPRTVVSGAVEGTAHARSLTSDRLEAHGF